MAAMSISFIRIVGSTARQAGPESGSVIAVLSAPGAIYLDSRHLSLHQ